MRPLHLLLFLALAALAAPARASAQLPGGDLGDMRDSRRAFLADVFRDVEATLRDFRTAWDADDVRTTVGMFTEDAAMIQAGDSVRRGRREIEGRLRELLPHAAGLRTTTVDFTAAGDLAYYAGRFTYLMTPAEGEHRAIAGTFVMVLQRQGRTWRVRSYVEIPDATASAAGG